MHKTGNVLNYLPNIQAHRWRDALPKATQGLQEILRRQTCVQSHGPVGSGARGGRQPADADVFGVLAVVLADLEAFQPGTVDQARLIAVADHVVQPDRA